MNRGEIDRDGEGVRQIAEKGYCSVNIWDGSEIKLAWSKKNSSYFENNFPVFLLSGYSNTSVFKVCNILRWVHFLVTKTSSNIFLRTLCWIWATMGSQCLNIIYIPFIFYYRRQTLFTLRVFHYYHHQTMLLLILLMKKFLLSFLLKLNSHQPCNRHWNKITALGTTAAVLKTC